VRGNPRKVGKHVSRYTKRPKRFRIGKKGEVALIGKQSVVTRIWRDDDESVGIGLSQRRMVRCLQCEIDQPIVDEVNAGRLQPQCTIADVKVAWIRDMGFEALPDEEFPR